MKLIRFRQRAKRHSRPTHTNLERVDVLAESDPKALIAPTMQLVKQSTMTQKAGTLELGTGDYQMILNPEEVKRLRALLA